MDDLAGWKTFSFYQLSTRPIYGKTLLRIISDLEQLASQVDPEFVSTVFATSIWGNSYTSVDAFTDDIFRSSTDVSYKLETNVHLDSEVPFRTKIDDETQTVYSEPNLRADDVVRIFFDEQEPFTLSFYYVGKSEQLFDAFLNRFLVPDEVNQQQPDHYVGLAPESQSRLTVIHPPESIRYGTQRYDIQA